MHRAYHASLPLPLYDSIIPRFNSRYLQLSITYRGSALWNTVVVSDPNIISARPKYIISKLRSITLLKLLSFTYATSVLLLFLITKIYILRR